MDSSKFNLWRACFSFTQVDARLADEEKIWLAEKSEFLKFTPEQRVTLEGDLKNPPDLRSILPLITKPSDRAFLIDQMRVLAHIDGKLSDVEKMKINEIKDLVLAKVNLSEAEKIVAADEMASYHEDEVYKINNETSFFERLHRYAQRALNKGDYKLPE